MHHILTAWDWFLVTLFLVTSIYYIIVSEKQRKTLIECQNEMRKAERTIDHLRDANDNLSRTIEQNAEHEEEGRVPEEEPRRVGGVYPYLMLCMSIKQEEYCFRGFIGTKSSYEEALGSAYAASDELSDKSTRLDLLVDATPLDEEEITDIAEWYNTREELKG